MCTGCAKPIHIRCVPKQDREGRSFLCTRCKPAAVQTAPPDVSASLASLSMNSPNRLSGANHRAKICVDGPSSARNQSESCCDEILLNETEEVSFDDRMTFLGFKRSPTQPNTIGDGACGVRALCDQLSSSCTDPMFGPEDHEFARRYTAMKARQMVRGHVIDQAVFEPNVNEWCTRMSKNHEFIDNIFLLLFARLLDRDIVVIPVNKKSAAGNDFAGNGDFRWIHYFFSTLHRKQTFIMFVTLF